MKMKIMAVIAVVVIVAAAGGAYLLLDDSRGSSQGYTASDYPSRLMVLGNANLDDYLDEKDVKYLEEVLSQEEIDYNSYYMCDANFDKVIDQQDLEYLKKMIAESWEEITYVYYVNVDHKVCKFDMTTSKKCITLIAPPLDNVLILNSSLVVGVDNRITTGKYAEEYNTVLDISKMVDVGNCNDPDKEKISQASKDNGGEMIVVCGTQDSYGPNMEEALAGSGVQVVRLPSWEYGATMQGFLTLGYLLDELDNAYRYMAWYDGVEQLVQDIVKTIPEEDRPWVAAVYAYTDSLQLLGEYTGEYANLMKLGVKDVAEKYLHGQQTGGHGNAINNEVISAMVDQYGMQYLIGMVGAPFQAQGEYQAMVDTYNHWKKALGPALSQCDFAICGYSFSSGVSEVLNQLILGKYLYPDYFADVDVEKYVNEYCQFLGIDDKWTYDSMNLLYCNDPSQDIMNNRK